MMHLLHKPLLPLTLILAVVLALPQFSLATPFPSDVASEGKAAKKAEMKVSKEGKKSEKRPKKGAKNPETGTSPSGGTLVFGTGGTLSNGSLVLYDGVILAPGSGPTIGIGEWQLATLNGGMFHQPILSSLVSVPTLIPVGGRTLIFPGGGSLVLPVGAYLQLAHGASMVLESSMLPISGEGSIFLSNGMDIPFSEDGTLFPQGGGSTKVPPGETWELSADGTITTGSAESL